MTTSWKCALCKKEQHNDKTIYGNNGRPVVDGIVCMSCNNTVLMIRLFQPSSLPKNIQRK
jgi:DNA-directed RNA polymerase subunit RPC12/RpoP